MRNYKTFFGILLLFFTSCDKPAVKPNSEMTFNDLQNKEVKFNEFVTIDMNRFALLYSSCRRPDSAAGQTKISCHFFDQLFPSGKQPGKYTCSK